MEVLLTFDVGTTSMKCCAFDASFNILAKTAVEYQLETKGEHVIEADPEIYFSGFVKSVGLIKEKGIDLSKVVSLGFTTQGETLTLVDGKGEPVAKSVVWLDDRAFEEAEELKKSISATDFSKKTGQPEIGGATPLAKLKNLLKNDYIGDHAYKALLLEDYLVFRLTGEYKTEHSLICSTGYYDIREHRIENGYLSLAGAENSLIPEVCKCGEIAGKVTREAAELCGLREGIPVVLTAMDQTCSAIGAGNVEKGIVSETTGTCLTALTTVERPFDDPGALQFYTHFDDGYLALAYNPTAAMIIKWLKDEFIKDTDGCRNSEFNAYDYMSCLAEKVPAGCDGMLVLPHFAGKLIPYISPDMRGCFYGVSVNSTKGHFIRGVMEGVAFMLKEDLDYFAKNGIVSDEIRSLGGGSRDSLWMKIKASVTGKNIYTLENEESTSLGAAILSAKGIGLISDVKAASRKAAKIRETFLPDENEREVYEKAYARYKKLDEAIRSFVGNG